MTYKEIDFIFPFIVFSYGFILTMTLNSHLLMGLAEKRLPYPMLVQFKAHRVLGAICLVLGGMWSLQNIWYA